MFSVKLDRFKSFCDYKSYQEYKKDIILLESRKEWRRVFPIRFGLYLKSFESVEDKENSLNIEIIKDLLLELEGELLSRDVVRDYVEILIYLTKCVELDEISVRKKAQTVLKALIGFFEPIAQQILIFRIFNLVSCGKCNLTKEAQVLAWLIDVYRQKISEPSLSNAFLSGLCHFYGEIFEIKYEDMLTAHHFYVAALLLITFHAQKCSKTDAKLLKTVKKKFIEPTQNQLADFLEMKKITKKAKNENSLNGEKTQCNVEEPMFVIELLKFTLTSTITKVNKALENIE